MPLKLLKTQRLRRQLLALLSDNVKQSQRQRLSQLPAGPSDPDRILTPQLHAP